MSPLRNSRVKEKSQRATYSQGACPLCGSKHQAYVYSKVHSRVVHCTNCGLLEDVAFDIRNQPQNHWSPEKLEKLSDLVQNTQGNVTLITTIRGNKSLERVFRQTLPAERLNVVDFAKLGSFRSKNESVFVDDHLLDQPNPREILSKLNRNFLPDQRVVFCIELIGGNHGWLRESLKPREAYARFWPDWVTFHKLLLSAGFEKVWLNNVQEDQHGTSMAIVSAKNGIARVRPKLSIVMPVFNEAATFESTFSRVLSKKIPGADKEIIIVESNSTDGTKDLVARVAAAPNVKVLWQERPRGKGHAVRQGIEASTGNIILIQDADLEYDVNDYDALVEELLSWRSTFVLGSRHTGDWKMRKFNDMPFMAGFFNLGHIFFVWLINVLIRAKMKDPFTMYKVFYKDCIYGLHFRYNRFDFDHELVIKLYRKGFHPPEIPVNYVARSFSEGKKVSFFKDGISWLVKDIKLATESLNSADLRKIP